MGREWLRAVAYLYEDFGGFNTGLVNAPGLPFRRSADVGGEVNLLGNWQVDGNDGTGF